MRCAAAILSASLLLVSACSKEAPPTNPEVAPEPAAIAKPARDPVTGLKMAGDWEIVRANCVACHSSRLIIQQRGSAQQWLTMIRWMQKKQNLWVFDPDTESKIINYLAEYYPPSEERRRAAIPPELMPPNPYLLEK
jgi:cytochrome c5